ncbi:MAG TPA: ABC transporter ATP-binding protein, partial [Nitrospira sp.]|nr:ABC transporter ATP-binding protein [Nitrospira sp.]
MRGIAKTYRLHGSLGDQLIDVLGLEHLGIRTRHPSKEFSALRDISLDIPAGERIGIIGRNGAGKTTLLKLICGNFAPSRGSIQVNGTVQALMNMGLGFHPEYTGRENVEAALLYNGLDRGEYLKAVEQIIEFCELGEFLDQPFKTYSLGMQARLMFAAATAVKPDILIVDEILGAGDAYFVAKSKRRIQTLINSGCTLLLVSHSMEQILEMCSRVVWLDQGKIRMQGEAFLVVKAYEEFVHGSVDGTSTPGRWNGENGSAGLQEADARKLSGAVSPIGGNGGQHPPHLQQPAFRPNGDPIDLPDVSFAAGREYRFEASGGISR